MARKISDCVTIYRRFRKTRDGKVLDAHAYGLKAWPIRIKPDRRLKPDA